MLVDDDGTDLESSATAEHLRSLIAALGWERKLSQAPTSSGRRQTPSQEVFGRRPI